jgi:ABC-2 type transport system permease protein
VTVKAPGPVEIASGPNPSLVSPEARWTGSTRPMQVWVLTTRSLRAAFGDVRMVSFGLLQPIVLLLLFSQVFRGLGNVAGVSAYRGYINFLMPGTLVMIAMTTAMSSGVGLMAEISTGFIGRLRTMPVSMSSVLVARTLSDTVRLAAQLVVVAAAAWAFLDYRPHGLVGMAGSIALALWVGWGVGWVFVAIATSQVKVEVMQALSFIVIFPLMFTSTAYVPVSSMPTWLQWVSKGNPLTYAIDAARRLAFGQPAGHSLMIAGALVAAAALLGGTVAVHRFRRPT